jgi:hypothetical protein
MRLGENRGLFTVVLAASAAVEVSAGHAKVGVAHIVGDVLEFGAALAGQVM